MTNIRVLLFTVGCILCITACEVSPKPPYEIGDMVDCHQEQEWDQSKVFDKLIGRWDWHFVSCYASPNLANEDASRGLSIEFKLDSTVHIYLDNVFDNFDHWAFEGSRNAISSPILDELYGTIFFCEEWVVFENSYVDVCDNYFRRAE